MKWYEHILEVSFWGILIGGIVVAMIHFSGIIPTCSCEATAYAVAEYCSL